MHRITDQTEATIDQDVMNNINLQNEDVDCKIMIGDLNCSVIDNDHTIMDHQRFQMEFNQFQNDQD